MNDAGTAGQAQTRPADVTLACRASYAMAKLEGHWQEFDGKSDSERARLLDPRGGLGQGRP